MSSIADGPKETYSKLEKNTKYLLLKFWIFVYLEDQVGIFVRDLGSEALPCDPLRSSQKHFLRWKDKSKHLSWELYVR